MPHRESKKKFRLLERSEELRGLLVLLMTIQVWYYLIFLDKYLIFTEKKLIDEYFIFDSFTGDGTNTPIPPSNTPQTPAGGTTSGDVTPSTATRLIDHRSDSLHQVLEQMRSLVLRENYSSVYQQNLQDSIDDGSFSDHWSHPTWANQTQSITIVASYKRRT